MGSMVSYGKSLGVHAKTTPKKVAPKKSSKMRKKSSSNMRRTLNNQDMTGTQYSVMPDRTTGGDIRNQTTPINNAGLGVNFAPKKYNKKQVARAANKMFP